MILQSDSLEIFGVYDRGVPNQERIVLHASGPVDLSLYGLLIGFRVPGGAEGIFPLVDQFLWLGRTFLQAPSWVFIYTGSGQAGVSQETHTEEPIHTLYWNKPSIIFSDHDVIPALVRFDKIEIGNQEPKSVLYAIQDKNKLDRLFQSLMPPADKP